MDQRDVDCLYIVVSILFEIKYFIVNCIITNIFDFNDCYI